MVRKPEAGSRKPEENCQSPRPRVSSSPRVSSGLWLRASGFLRFLHCGSWLLLFSVLAPGCITNTPNYSVKPATAIDPATRRMNYWFDEPANDSVANSDYDALWNAARLWAAHHATQTARVSVADQYKQKIKGITGEDPRVTDPQFDFNSANGDETTGNGKLS